MEKVKKIKSIALCLFRTLEYYLKNKKKSLDSKLYYQMDPRVQSIYVPLAYFSYIFISGKNVVFSVTQYYFVKFIYSEKATKFLRNLPLTFDYSKHGQKLGEDFAKFCGLLRIYELYFTAAS